MEEFHAYLSKHGSQAKVIAKIEDQQAISNLEDIVKASESVNEWIDKRQDSLPSGAKLTLWTDNAVDFKSRMATIGGSAGIGLLLVLIFLVLTLRPIVAFWVAVGIATAYAGAFVLLPSVGVSLNMLSTFAFLLVLARNWLGKDFKTKAD